MSPVRAVTALMAMPRNKLIEEQIELRRRQPLERLPPRTHFQHLRWAVYEWPFAQCRANDPGRHVKVVILRVHLAGIMFKAPWISRFRSENQHRHHAAAALTRNDLALNHFLGFRKARRRRSEEHTSELQSLAYLVCRLLLEKKKT